jgi:hypothetical protein
LSRTLVKMHFGSRVYGTSGPRSDTDYRAVHVPDSMDILLQRVKQTVTQSTKLDPTAPNSPDDVDFTSYSLQHYSSLLLKGTTDCLEMLFTPDTWIVEATPEWEAIRQSKELWLYRGVDSMVGFCRGKMNQYGIFGGKRIAAAEFAWNSLDALLAKHGSQKRLDEVWDEIRSMASGSCSEHIQVVEIDPASGQPQKSLSVCDKRSQASTTLKDAHKAIKKLNDDYAKRVAQAESGEGLDWKELMHVVRVCHEAQELLLEHRISFPRPEAELLLRIRGAELSYQQVADLIDDGLQRISECQSRSSLPEVPDQEAAERFVADVYRQRVLST